MRAPVAAHDALARLIAYPRPGYAEAAEEWCSRVEAACPAAAETLRPFVVYANSVATEELEELYTRTFDNSPDHALEIGWHVFGENYSRGAFLVRMRNLLDELRLPEGSELPDHLTHLLAVLARCEPEYASRLVHASILPAVKKVAESLASMSNPYADVLRATAEVLATHDLPLTPGSPS
ncbi:MAG: nitrate reductase molybdenum cofactor assembly chaperone [Planctomycetota bacterium]|jgi:nitrate reductase molybdenum cofactor assembly chaperone